MQPKLKFFIVSIDEKVGDYNLEQKAIEAINVFLSDANHVYLNHAITVLGKDTSLSGNNYRDISLVVSLVYKDLNETTLQLTKVSAKTKEIVRKSIEKNSDVPQPELKTKFETFVEESAKKNLDLLFGDWKKIWGTEPNQNEIATINQRGEYLVDGEHWLSIENVITSHKDTISFILIGVKPGDNRTMKNVLTIKKNGSLLEGTETHENNTYNVVYNRVYSPPIS